MHQNLWCILFTVWCTNTSGCHVYDLIVLFEPTDCDLYNCCAFTVHCLLCPLILVHQEQNVGHSFNPVLTKRQGKMGEGKNQTMVIRECCYHEVKRLKTVIDTNLFS